MKPTTVLSLFLLAIPNLGAQDGAEWPQWRGPTRDGVWREGGLLKELPDTLTTKWRAPIGTGYCGPTVARGRVYVMDRLQEPAEVERIHCFDWKRGRQLWVHEYACSYAGVSYKAGPRCSILVADGLAYCLGTMGHLHCLDAATGKIAWSHDIKKKYGIRMPVWGIAAAPLIEGDLLIVPASAKGNACLIAFDKKTGQERWKALPDGGNYSAPIVIDQARRRVLVYWAAERIVGVAPETGELLWQHAFKPRRMPLGVASPVLYEDKLFFTGFFDGCLLLKVDQERLRVAELWRRRGRNELRTDGLHSTISTPIIRGGHIYGIDSYGQLRCLKLGDGTRVWEDLTAVPKARWATIHMVQNGELTWMFNERGELIIAQLSPKRFHEIDRADLIRPTREQLNQRGGVCWTHPAFAYGHIFVRNDEELVCADLRSR